jgi:hypothetical protein
MKDSSSFSGRVHARRRAGTLGQERRPARATYNAYINSTPWRHRRDAALDAAGHRCQVCNSPDGLEVHHRTYVRFGSENPDDLTVLCEECHTLYHGRFGMRTDPQPERYERFMNWLVGELQCGLNSAIEGLSWESERNGRAHPLLREAVFIREYAQKAIDKQFRLGDRGAFGGERR